MICGQCTSTLIYTTYVRAMRRNARTHRSKQAYIAAGLLCLDCNNFQLTIEPEEVERIRERRRPSLDAANEPIHTCSGVEHKADTSATTTANTRPTHTES